MPTRLAARLVHEVARWPGCSLSITLLFSNAWMFHCKLKLTPHVWLGWLANTCVHETLKAPDHLLGPLAPVSVTSLASARVRKCPCKKLFKSLTTVSESKSMQIENMLKQWLTSKTASTEFLNPAQSARSPAPTHTWQQLKRTACTKTWTGIRTASLW